MDARAAIVAEARTWLGTPYVPCARVKGAGVDCGQLLIGVFHACGLIPNVDPGPYSPDWHLHHSEELYLGQVLGHADPVDDPQPGDIALFQFGRCVSHGAIVVAWPHVIHAYRGQGCVLADGTKEELAMDNAGKSRFRGFFRLKGL